MGIIDHKKWWHRKQNRRKWRINLIVALLGVVIAAVYVSMVITVSRRHATAIGDGVLSESNLKKNNGQLVSKERTNQYHETPNQSEAKKSDSTKGNTLSLSLQQYRRQSKPRLKRRQPNTEVKHIPIHKTGKRPELKARPHGEGVNPQSLFPQQQKAEYLVDSTTTTRNDPIHPDPVHVLKAFIEPINFNEWEEKPLPIRKTASADQLVEVSFPKLNSCQKIPEMIPADQYPEQDTFLPWIHDVFPTDDGKFIQIVAQNRRRCHTGQSQQDKKAMNLTQPNIALFQHVPVKRIIIDGESRYQLTSHEEADPDGIATRFICRFKPTMEETLSIYNFDYDYASHRKKHKHTFKLEEGGTSSVHTSQLIFKCPVPENLVEKIRSGTSVVNDWATLFLDLVPIRTPPRYGLSNEFLQPHYADRLPNQVADRFNPHREWGDNHVLPRIEDSGRWENIPICQSSLMQHHPAGAATASALSTAEEVYPKKYRLAACIWASAGFATRGNLYAINDGQRRLYEWIHMHKMLGFEHFYLYDNSYAFSSQVTLKPIADLFPEDVTYIKWPFQVCNNNLYTADSPGERSSQYAAESSCRLRFGPHVDWLGNFDIDEYLIPMQNDSLIPLLDKLDSEGTKILSLKSWQAKPRRDCLE